jgi:hypothetical protein
MLDWPPKPITATCPNPKPAPIGTAMHRIFDWVYLTMPKSIWSLPPRQRSKEVLRRVFAASKSFTMPSKGLDYMATDPELHGLEYANLAAMANAVAADVDAVIEQFHRTHADLAYPAMALDPARRMERWP